MSPGKSASSKIKSRVNNIQKASVLPSYHREKSRQVSSALRYTNSLPSGYSHSHCDIPLHLRQSIDRLGSDPPSEPKSMFVTIIL